MKKEELLARIQLLEERIKVDQDSLLILQGELAVVKEQEQERRHYITSKEILDLIYEQTGKQGNMATVKRWADEGYLGEIIDEKEKFAALRLKQGKKRFLYLKKDVYAFLYSRGYIHPRFEVLDRIHCKNSKMDTASGIIILSYLSEDQFHYTIQLENGQVLTDVEEHDLTPP